MLREECDREPDNEMDFPTASQSGTLGRAVAHFLDSGSAVLQVPARQGQGWIVRVWRGISILEVTAIIRHARGRIPRDIGPGNQELLALHFRGKAPPSKCSGCRRHPGFPQSIPRRRLRPMKWWGFATG